MRASVVLTGREGATPADFAPLQAEEAWHVWALQGTGQIRAMHFRADRLGVVIEIGGRRGRGGRGGRARPSHGAGRPAGAGGHPVAALHGP